MLDRTGRLCLVAAALATAFGCQTSMTHMTPARALDPLHVEGGINMSASLATSVVTNNIDTARVLVDQARKDEITDISEDQLRDILDGTLAVALFKPGVTPEFMLRIGVTDKVLEGIDFGVRYNGSVLKGDAKLQLWESEDATGAKQAVAVDFGYGHHLGVVGSIFEYLTLTSFSRFDLDASVHWGWEYPDILRVWAAPRFMASRIGTEPKLPEFVRTKLPAEVAEYDPSKYFQNEWLMHYGGTAGVMIGYKYVFFVVELTAVWVDFKPKIIDQQRNFSGMIFAPGIGLVGTY